VQPELKVMKNRHGRGDRWMRARGLRRWPTYSQLLPAYVPTPTGTSGVAVSNIPRSKSSRAVRPNVSYRQGRRSRSASVSPSPSSRALCDHVERFREYRPDPEPRLMGDARSSIRKWNLPSEG
jgi:hypothetical protein